MSLFAGNASDAARRRFRARLLRWYGAHRRRLPWRNTRDPYRIWVSEVMLQQTRVAAVLAHYREFLRRFPNLKKLAAARESSVLAAWSGLGYYGRARSLRAAARQMVRDYRGRFPREVEKLRRLPGIGRYTAAAIASIAFGRAEAVVDGNVARVLERLSGARVTSRAQWRQAESLLDPRQPGDFNQAMMELGATVCLPGAPRCDRCPVFTWCRTRGAAPGSAPAPRQRKKQVSYSLAARKDAVRLTQRGAHDSLMPRMWELPQAAPRNGTSRPQPAVLLRLRHSITDTDYRVTVVRGAARPGAPGRWVQLSRLPRMPLTGLARKILRRSRLLA